MRLGVLILPAAAMLAACGPSEPSSTPPPPTAAEAAALAQRPSVQAPPEVPFKPIQPLPTDTEQARAQAGEAQRALDRTAATLQADVAGATRQADEAVRNAATPEPRTREPAMAREVPPPSPPSPITPTVPPPPAPG